MNIFKEFITKRNTKKKFNKLTCHPKNITYKNSKSCIDTSTLKKLKNIWNKRYPDNKIKTNNDKHIWQFLKTKFKHSCANELCWINSLIKDNKYKRKLKKSLFAPSMPYIWKKNINEWLNSNDILNVMKQYEEADPQFEFFGPSPIDYDTIVYNNSCVWPEICNINMKNLFNKQKTKIGFIFNTDKHYEEGSHWIALYIDLNKKIIFFFDSNGSEIPLELNKLINNIIYQCENKLCMKIKFDSNVGFIHQRSNTECGMYCLYFLISLLKKKHNEKYFKSKRIKDKKVESLRKVYFNNI